LIILGVDPGLSGALAFYDTVRGDLEILDMPTLKAGTGSKRIVDEDTLAREIDCRAAFVTHAFIELVGTRPGEGAVGAFSFGLGFGLLRGILAANFVPRTLVRPAEWKKAMRVPAEKDGARARASQLFPRHSGKWVRVKDDGRAEASCIALFGSQRLK
jgi:crossover junction endodeoxyribonuclease RuvC